MLTGLIIFIPLWLAFAAVCAAAHRLDVRSDVVTGLAMLAGRAHAHLFQRVRFEGLDLIPRGPRPFPLIVVANHTAGVDPIIVQAACPFHVRWMMMRQMMVPALDRLWDFLEIIAVGPGESQSARTALRHLKDGGVLGIFPEGTIERPPGRLLPFQPGTGLLVQRSGAGVLLMAITGTPANASAFASILTPGRARVRVVGLIDYSTSGLDAAGIAKDLQDRLAHALGWTVGPPSPADAGA
ncbi:MAG: 1-acyl-sn-glycerol-3-phosphate acyltransferase [Phycisphaerales bacterium]|nr:1-acyl-sn-glycerol-3-phosphate acyltransferase [Phycisphaerales bacterium]